MIARADARGLDEALRLLTAGEVVAMPTETVYGLAGDARSETALLRIFSVKARPLFDPLIVHVPWPPLAGATDPVAALAALGVVDEARVERRAREVVAQLVARFWPGPLTLVLPRGALPDLVSSGLPTVAVRAPHHPVADALLRRSGMPLAAPSANRFGRISPTSAQAVADELGDRVPLILDGGACAVGVESTVVEVRADGILVLLRPGGTPADALAQVASLVARGESSTGPQLSPGLLASHYAPRKPLRLIGDEPLPDGRIGLLLFSDAGRARLPSNVVAVRVLSAGGDLAEAARNLFAALRALDDSDAEVLLYEACPEEGLGVAILDRLRRASAPR